MAGRLSSLRQGRLVPGVLLMLLVCAYVALLKPVTNYMHNKPFVEKLGTLPRVEVLRVVAADQKQLVAASLVMKVMMYFGGLMENDPGRYKIPPDYQSMSRILHGSVKLDPYNMDAYYFAQALLVWDVGAYRTATDLLVYGMKYRTWDWYLPFFAGFNSAYFLKDYPNAAKYYQRAAELSGEWLFATLAGRYMQETGQTELALVYLKTMAKSAKNQAIKKLYQVRLQALQRVRLIEKARDEYLQSGGSMPVSIETLVKRGHLASIPVDPYGGNFFLEPDGKVNTTSEFTFGKLAREQLERAGGEQQ